MRAPEPGTSHDGEGPPARATLSATAPVALRWWPADESDPVQLEAQCAAGLRALEACLEGEPGKQAAPAPGRLEAKLDLVLVMLGRIDDAIAAREGGGMRGRFLPCTALLRSGSIEWDDPAPPPSDGTAVLLELRAATGHPVSATLRATLTRIPAAARADGTTRMVATLAPMAAPLRDSYERCLFILHRQAVRRAHSAPEPD